jgi:CBS domain-containing protein
MKVRDLMTTGVASVRSNEALSEAVRLMFDCDCGAVPVTESGTGHVIGMITDRDICMATWSREQAPIALAISDAMSRELYYCSPDDDVAAVEELMQQRQIRRVPVLDEERKLVGILSIADIVTESQRGGTLAASELTSEQIAATLANICQPRPPGSFRSLD